MGQQANSGRNASLDEKKRRAAGRQQHAPEREAIMEGTEAEIMKKTAGAFGKEGMANRRATGGAGEGGGGVADAKGRDADVRSRKTTH